MTAYIIRRLLLVIPTLLGIMTINFFVIQAAPGGPVEQFIAKLEGQQVSATERFSGSGSTELMPRGRRNESNYRGAQGLDPALIARIEKMYGFDKPLHQRFLDMLRDYAVFDFGSSFSRSFLAAHVKVYDVIPSPCKAQGYGSAYSP